MIFLGTPQLRGGVNIFFFYKVSFEKHPSVDLYIVFKLTVICKHDFWIKYMTVSLNIFCIKSEKIWNKQSNVTITWGMRGLREAPFFGIVLPNCTAQTRPKTHIPHIEANVAWLLNICIRAPNRCVLFACYPPQELTAPRNLSTTICLWRWKRDRSKIHDR